MNYEDNQFPETVEAFAKTDRNKALVRGLNGDMSKTFIIQKSI